jgi:hypothetical protein
VLSYIPTQGEKMAETYQYLEPADKNAIVENHLRNIEYNMFNNEISIAEANIADPTDPILIASLESDIAEAKEKIAALKALLVVIPDTGK